MLDHKLPPQNIEYEQSVLGSAIIDQDSRELMLRILTENDFYRTGHQKIFTAIATLQAANEPIDLVTLHNRLKQFEQVEMIGGAAYLSQLTNEVPIPSSMNHYCQVIKNCSHKRKGIEALYRASNQLYSEQADSSQILASVVNDVISISSGEVGNKSYSVGELSVPWLDDLEDRFERKQIISGVPCGFRGIDNAMAGLQPSTLNVIAARPGMGKTSLSLNISHHAALNDYPVLVFSLEMSKEELYGRLMASDTGVEMYNFKRGMVNQSGWIGVTDAAGRHQKLPIIINDSDGLTYQKIRNIARMDVKRFGIKLIVIDHLGLVTGGDHRSRDREIGIYTSQFKGMAKELKIPVVLLSQLNRKLEDRNNKRPVLSDLRDSGNVEQDADTVIFIYRPAVYGEDELFPGHTELLLRKHRDGPLCSVKIQFIKETATFQPVSDGETCDYDN